MGISSTEELQLAVRLPAAEVTAPVEPFALADWISHERQPSAVGIIDIPTADTDAGKDDLAQSTKRHRCQVLIDDINVDVVDSSAKRDPRLSWWSVHDLVVGVVRRFGQSIRVDEFDGRLGCKPALGELLG